MLHAYILTGSREAAVERARELAAEALCQGEPPRPCRACRACRKVFRGVHPDVTVVERRTDESGKPRKEILVDQIRALSAEAVVRPNEGSARVYIFPEAEAMNTSAQNAFLKLLEEPPVQAYFLLCAEDPERLLETVRSRCAQLRLGGAAAAAGKKVRDRAGAFLAAGASFSASAAGALPSAASFTGVSVFFFGITGLPFGYHDRSLTMTAGGGALPLLQRFPAPRAALYHNSLQIKSLVYV